MNAKEILNKASKIIARQDIDRELLLFFINTLRRSLVRDKKVSRFYQYKKNITCVNGIIDTIAINLKNAETVEYNDTLADPPILVSLTRIAEYNQAMLLYGSLDVVGSPGAYIRMGDKIQILPIPINGEINIYGEFYPDDMIDSDSCSDIMTVEIPEALIYLGCAEYFDMLGEADKANYWRNKGLQIFATYLTQLKHQEVDGIDMLARDPFGNVTKESPGLKTYGGVTMNDLDFGGW